jgi:hypothetical protein
VVDGDSATAADELALIRGNITLRGKYAQRYAYLRVESERIVLRSIVRVSSAERARMQVDSVGITLSAQEVRPLLSRSAYWDNQANDPLQIPLPKHL